MDIPGIDISKWQGVINWAQVKTQWCVARATLGHTYQDGQYVANMRGMRDHGILRGAYHVLTPNMSTADEIRNFEGQLNKGPDPDFLVLDVELDKGQQPQVIKSKVYNMLIEMENLGYKDRVLIYTADWFWSNKVGGGQLSGSEYKPLPEDWALWVAHYKPLSSPPKLPLGWDTYFAWQHSDDGQMEGIDAEVDLNIMKESYFRQLGGQPGPAPIPVPGKTFKFEGTGTLVN